MRLSTRLKRKIPRIHSITLYRTAILMLLAPVAMAIFAWIYGWAIHDDTGFSQQMVDTLSFPSSSGGTMTMETGRLT